MVFESAMRVTDEDDCKRHKAMSRLDHHDHSPVVTAVNTPIKSFLDTIMTNQSKHTKHSFHKSRATHVQLKSLRIPKYYRGSN